MTTLRRLVAAPLFSDTVADATMSRVLHLHPARCDFQTARSLDLLVKKLSSEISMAALSFGPGGDFGNPLEAILRLRFAHEARTAQIAHAWGPAELLVAVAAGFPRIIFSPQAKPHQKWWPWINRLVRRRPVEIVCPTAWMRDLFISRGASADRCRVIYPAIDMSRLNGFDPGLRTRLGLADSDMVLLAPGESAREARHGASLWAAAILNVLDPKWRLLVWGRGPMIGSLEQFARSSKLNGVLINAERRLGEPIDFERIVSVADAALVFSEPAVAVLPVGISMAAGLPVIASETLELREFLQGDINALVEPSTNPRRLAQQTLALSQDFTLRQRIVERAKVEAAERFAANRFLADWRGVYTSFC
jgi:glycosyltransferase involved in cell wall biosynthesis